MSTFDAKASRESLRSGLIESTLDALECQWISLHVQDQVTSTNDVALSMREQVAAGQAIAVTADEQVQGRGRLDRTWSSPWAAGIALSIACSTEDIQGAVTSVPLRVGLAIVDALKALGLTYAVKWPNDIVTLDGELLKLGGILVAHHGDVVVIGIGINVSLESHELPTSTSTSIALQGDHISREELIAHIIACVRARISDDSWTDDYRSACRTLGESVRVTRIGQDPIVGRATDISDIGELHVATDNVVIAVSVGDVEHLRIHNVE